MVPIHVNQNCLRTFLIETCWCFQRCIRKPSVMKVYVLLIFLIGQQYRSFGRICIVNLPTKKSVVCMSLFLPRFNEKINDCNIMRKTCYLIGARHMLSVTETWVMTWIVAGEHPSQEVCTLNAPSSIFAEDFQLLSLDKYINRVVQKVLLFHLFWIEGEKDFWLVVVPLEPGLHECHKQSRAQIFQKQ